MRLQLKFRWFVGILLTLVVLIPLRSLLLYENPPIAIGNMLYERVLAPSFGGHVFLLVLVLTSPGGRLQRDVIRETWGSASLAPSTRFVFVLGGQNDLDSDVRNEFSVNKDLIIGSFPDTYRNLVLKVFVALNWARTQNCTYVLKADDDVYINIPRLLNWLRNPSLPEPLYAGEVVEGNRVLRWPPWSKYRIPRDVYNEEIYPPYCRGAFYVLSRSALPGIMQEVNKHSTLLPMEDAYLGIMARSASLSPVQIPGCKSSRSVRSQIVTWNETTLRHVICSGDAFDESILRYLTQFPSTRA
ncbi:beta-1,3-galactosyltransferase 4-like [Nematostella vectensis]|uniref:beta-1,3-galactosyltransferase 4-like n=1 Tax=Nematostella vectensis TaxID=45351 RepID=UPI0020773FCF|nr:beta-1,3-galactosyltransferase 4-like [Nematostella vectensis]